MSKKVMFIIVVIIVILVTPFIMYKKFQKNIDQLEEMGFVAEVYDGERFTYSGSADINENYSLSASMGILHGLDIIATYTTDGNSSNYASYYQNEKEYYTYYVEKGVEPTFCETDPETLEITSKDLTCFDYTEELSNNQEIYEKLFFYIDNVIDNVL